MAKSSGFKMKGSPMQRNFGISPMKETTGWRDKLRAAGETISEIRESSTPGQLWRTYKSKKKDYRDDNIKEETRDDEAN